MNQDFNEENMPLSEEELIEDTQSDEVTGGEETAESEEDGAENASEDSKDSKDSGDDKEKEGSIWKDIFEMVIYFVIVLFVSILIVTFVGQRTIVDGESMYPTLNDKDNLIVDKISYRFSDPKRFDVIVFPYQHAKRTYYIKRIIGLPGEEVYIDPDGNILIDGEILQEDYGYEVIINPGRADVPIQLGDDEYFVLGDNRNNSSDSRDYMVGNIKRKDFIGRAWLRIYPFKDWGIVKHGDKAKE